MVFEKGKHSLCSVNAGRFLWHSIKRKPNINDMFSESVAQIWAADLFCQYYCDGGPTILFQGRNNKYWQWNEHQYNHTISSFVLNTLITNILCGSKSEMNLVPGGRVSCVWKALTVIPCNDMCMPQPLDVSKCWNGSMHGHRVMNQGCKQIAQTETSWVMPLIIGDLWNNSFVLVPGQSLDGCLKCL